MATSAAEYLEQSVPGRHPDLPDSVSGTVRLDLQENAHTDHWYLTIRKQDVEVMRSAEEADLVIRADRKVFDQLIAEGRHLAAALMCNDVTAEGDLPLLLALRRIFPGPPGARHPKELAGERSRRP